MLSKRKKSGFFVCDIDVYVKKIVIYMCYILEMRYTLSCQQAETEEKNEKRSSEIFGVKWIFFPKERLFENLFRENFFSVPPNSAPGLRVWRGSSQYWLLHWCEHFFSQIKKEYHWYRKIIFFSDETLKPFSPHVHTERSDSAPW